MLSRLQKNIINKRIIVFGNKYTILKNFILYKDEDLKNAVLYFHFWHLIRFEVINYINNDKNPVYKVKLSNNKSYYIKCNVLENRNIIDKIFIFSFFIIAFIIYNLIFKKKK